MYVLLCGDSVSGAGILHVLQGLALKQPKLLEGFFCFYFLLPACIRMQSSMLKIKTHANDLLLGCYLFLLLLLLLLRHPSSSPAPFINPTFSAWVLSSNCTPISQTRICSTSVAARERGTTAGKTSAVESV